LIFGSNTLNPKPRNLKLVSLYRGGGVSLCRQSSRGVGARWPRQEGEGR